MSQRFNYAVPHRMWFWFTGLLGLLIAVSATHAQLNPWSINEIYSSSDGSIQFIELSTSPASGGQLGAGYQFLAQNGAETHSSATGVSQFSGGGFQTLLFATTGFTQLAGQVAPDYIIPSRFLFTPGGSLSVNTVSGQFPSFLSYLNLPTDGIHSLDRDGIITLATPRNFAGQIGVVPEPSSMALFLAAFMIFIGRRLLTEPDPARRHSDHAECWLMS